MSLLTWYITYDMYNTYYITYIIYIIYITCMKNREGIKDESPYLIHNIYWIPYDMYNTYYITHMIYDIHDIYEKQRGYQRRATLGYITYNIYYNIYVT